MVKSYWWGGGVGWGGGVVAYGILLSTQSQLDLDLIFDWFGFGFGSRRTGLETRA